MKLRSRGVLLCAAPLATLLLLSGCDSNRPVPTSEVERIEIPLADIDNQQNTNITNPTLEIPTTFPIGDGDLLTLVWSDEFNDAALDPEEWFYESGDGTQYGIPSPSFGNNELQYYLPDNVQLSDGKLVITAKRERAEQYNVTSGRIMTRDRFAFTYGRIEASIKLPPGQGIWPAFWMLPQDDAANATPGFGTYGEYAQSGEIDIVEAVNLKGSPGPGGVGGGNEIFSTIHFGGPSRLGQNLSTETRYTPGVDVTAGFNTYAFEWDPFEMRWFFNGILFKVENSWSSTGGPFPAPFDAPFYVLFNLAVGGNFPGPLANDALPAVMEVDWVRVYTGQPPPPPDFDSGLLVNGDFEAGTAPWLAGVSDPISAANIIPDADNPGRNVYFVNVTGSDPDQPFLVNLSQKLSITPGETYELTFRARSNTTRTIIAGIGLSDGDFSNTTETVNLTAEWQDFTVELTAAGFGDANSRVLFDLNGADGEVFLDEVRLVVSEGGGEPPFDGGLVVNGDFEAGTSPWRAGVDNPIDMADIIDDALDPGNSVFFKNVTGSDPNQAFLVNLSQRGITITQGESYQLSFRARSNVARTIIAGIGLSGGNFANTNEIVSLTTAWQDFTLTLTATDFGDGDSRVLFDLNGEDGEVYIDNVRLVVSSGGGTPPPGGSGELVNGDFETGGLNGWTQTQVPAGVGSITADSSGQGGRTGTVARLAAVGSAPSSTNDVLISQEGIGAGTVASGDSIDVSFDLFGTPGPGSVVFVEVIFLNAAGEDNGRDFVSDSSLPSPDTPYTPTATWTTYSGTVIAGTTFPGGQADVSGGVVLSLKVACGPVDGCNPDVSFDNVSLTIN